MPLSIDATRALVYQIWDELQPRLPAGFSRPEVVLEVSDRFDLCGIRLQLSDGARGVGTLIPHEDLLDARSPAGRIEATLRGMAAELYRNIPGPWAGRAGSGSVPEPVAEWEKDSGWRASKTADVTVPIEVQRLAEMRSLRAKEAEQRMRRALAAEDAVVPDAMTIEEINPGSLSPPEMLKVIRDLRRQLAAGGEAKTAAAPVVPVDDLANGRVIRE